MQKFEVQTDNSALSQIFTSNDLSDLYAKWYHKLVEFESMSIKYWSGHKLYCADVWSRLQPVHGEEKSPFCVDEDDQASLRLSEPQTYNFYGLVTVP